MREVHQSPINKTKHQLDSPQSKGSSCKWNTQGASQKSQFLPNSQSLSRSRVLREKKNDRASVRGDRGGDGCDSDANLQDASEAAGFNGVGQGQAREGTDHGKDDRHNGVPSVRRQRLQLRQHPKPHQRGRWRHQSHRPGSDGQTLARSFSHG